MKTPNTIEEEIDDIRLKIYERTKNMSPSELTKYYRKSGEALARKYGFTIIDSANENTIPPISLMRDNPRFNPAVASLHSGGGA